VTRELLNVQPRLGEVGAPLTHLGRLLERMRELQNTEIVPILADDLDADAATVRANGPLTANPNSGNELGYDGNSPTVVPKALLNVCDPMPNSGTAMPFPPSVYRGSTSTWIRRRGPSP
jgi:hypothetical protein